MLLVGRPDEGGIGRHRFDTLFDELTAAAAVAVAMPWSAVIIAVPAVLLGYVVLGLSGFDSALVIVPMLAWHWTCPHAPPT